MKALIKNPFFWIALVFALVIIVAAIKKYRDNKKAKEVETTTTTKTISITPAAGAAVATA